MIGLSTEMARVKEVDHGNFGMKRESDRKCVNRARAHSFDRCVWPEVLTTISVQSPIILPLQTFFSRVLLLRQQAFSSGNLPPERLKTTTNAVKTQVFMFRYERVNSTRKFTIVADIVSLLKKIYKRDAPFRAVFEVKTLAVLFQIGRASCRERV